MLAFLPISNFLCHLNKQIHFSQVHEPGMQFFILSQPVCFITSIQCFILAVWFLWHFIPCSFVLIMRAFPRLLFPSLTRHGLSWGNCGCNCVTRHLKTDIFKCSVPKSRAVHPKPALYDKPAADTRISSNDSSNIPIRDRFGSLAAEADATLPSVHQSIKTERSTQKTIDTLLQEPIEDQSQDVGLRRDRWHPRYQRNSQLLAKYCNSGNVTSALEVFFDTMLTRDRVAPTRFDTHMLLQALSKVGQSEDAFRVYKKMKEIGIQPTQATYSRLFKACAEDCGVWYRENEHLFIGSNNSNTSLSSIQRRKNELVKRALSSGELLEQFGGPGLKRAQMLWHRLRAKDTQLTLITYNTLILALAKDTIEHDYKSQLNAPLLTELVGLLPMPQSQSTALENEFDEWEHVLIRAVRRPGVVPDIGFYNALINRRTSVGISAKRLLGEAIGMGLLPDQRALSSGELLEQFGGPGLKRAQMLWHRLRAKDTQLTLITYNTLILALAKGGDLQGCLTVLDAMLTTHSPKNSPVADSFTLSALLSAFKPFAAKQELLRCLNPNETSTQPDLFERILTIWHRLAPHLGTSLSPHNFVLLVGAVKSIPPFGTKHANAATLTIKTSDSAPLLIADSAPLLIAGNAREADQDRLSVQPNNTVASTVVTVSQYQPNWADIGLSLTSPINLLRPTRQEFSVTWGSLARGCRSVASVRKLIQAFSDSSKIPVSIDAGSSSRISVTVRPSLTFFTSLLSASHFNWDVKAYVLRLMMGEEERGTVATSKHTVVCDGVAPDRRLIASLDVEVALFRELMTNNVIPADGSQVAASSATGGFAIPAYAASSFRRFIPVYKRWLRTCFPSDTSPTDVQSSETIRGS
ncbi:hypothetical protein AHF37_07091 [Paragonimus kellicotti]|nr:hypothetical protein AHF37_07091 [Paragonimus kellicotti]